MARKKSRAVGQVLYRIGKRAVCGPVLGPERNWPSGKKAQRWWKRVTGTSVLYTGPVQQPAAKAQTRSASRDRIEQRTAQRKAERTRRTTRPDPAAQRRPASRRATATQVTTDEQMTQLSCDWCRSTNARPQTTGNGMIRIVTGVLPCNHTPFLPDGTFQHPLGPTGLVCPGCDNTGGPDGKGCPTCQGFIVRWSEFGGVGAMPKGTPRIKKAPARRRQQPQGRR